MWESGSVIKGSSIIPKILKYKRQINYIIIRDKYQLNFLKKLAFDERKNVGMIENLCIVIPSS